MGGVGYHGSSITEGSVCDFGRGSLRPRRSLSKQMGSGVLDTRRWTGDLVASQVCATWRWPVALNLNHTMYLSQERLQATPRELGCPSSGEGSGAADFLLVLKRVPRISEKHWEISDC